MLIDSFLFNNEFEIAEARLKYLNDTVDYFVIAEASVSHSGKRKPLHWQERNFLAEDFSHKIIHIVLDQDDFKHSMEKVHGVPTDIIGNIIGTSRKKIGEEVAKRFERGRLIYSDLDEIPRKEAITVEMNSVTLLEHSLHYYFIDCCCVTKPFTRLPWSMVIEIDLLKDMNLNELRNKVFETQGNYLSLLSYTVDQNSKHVDGHDELLNKTISEIFKVSVGLVSDAGWHLSYMGGVDRVIDKMKSSGHVEIFGEFDFDRAALLKKLNAGVDFLGRKMEFTFVNPELLLPKDLLQHFPEEFFSGYSCLHL